MLGTNEAPILLPQAASVVFIKRAKSGRPSKRYCKERHPSFDRQHVLETFVQPVRDDMPARLIKLPAYHPRSLIYDSRERRLSKMLVFVEVRMPKLQLALAFLGPNAIGNGVIGRRIKF